MTEKAGLPEPIEDGKRDNALDFGRHPSAPATIKPANIQEWKKSVSPTFTNYFSTKYDRLMKEWEDLITEYWWNKAVYESSMGFKPVIGKTYYLYQREWDGQVWLSLLAPQESGWTERFIGGFQLTPEHSWKKVS
ncbi:MAG: DUF2452 domain-containing protein [Betaproteobacteria bacterium]|jgi:hypothetical protein